MVTATKPKIVRQLKQVQGFVEDLGKNITLDMILIPSGSFQMGTPDDEIERLCKEYDVDYFKRESPQHEVSIPLFFMGRYPITQAQWRAIAILDPIGKQLQPEPSNFKGDNRPVEQISWQDAIEFCARLSRLTGKNYRLPSEAEWEYACRAGTTTPFHFGETISTDLANYEGADEKYGAYGRGLRGEYRKETTDVDYFKVANAFGLSDMHGNVWQWCLDPWHSDYKVAPNDGRVWDEGKEHLYEDISKNLDVLLQDDRTHVVRGGSWGNRPGYCRSAARRNFAYLYLHQGFRVVCVPPRTGNQ
jgi:formylglycine-generating enzyme required for sulfatase activity